MNSTKIPESEYKEEIKNIIADVRRRITLNGRKKVFEQKRKLLSIFLKEEMDPEAFTKKFIIEKIFDLLKLKVLPERHFRTVKGIRKVDYRAKNLNDRMFLVEAKPINADLHEKGDEGAVNQIKGLFRLAEVKENYNFGLATDGLTWIFIDRNGEITAELDLLENYDKIKDFLLGEERVISQKTEEEITKRFYDWYNALLHGGKYKDRENKTKWVSESDCLVNNIFNVQNLGDKEQIAQSIVNRLIFIKFLQSKEIIEKDILAYLSNLSEDILNEKLKQIFFRVLNTPKDERIDIDPNFADIPYLNGSLFIKTDVERQNTDYRMKAEILKEIIKFLDSFKFIHKESFENGDSIDPEILGYIFERAMTSFDRKGTGAYYTPKQITKYIAENTVYLCIIEKINVLLKEEKGYKEKELIKNIEDIFILHETTLNEIWNKIILNLKVCDNACGSGAFLLATGNILFELSKKICKKLNIRNPDPVIKKMILLKNLYGVDINPNAVEIAKLRLWLWLVASYDPENIQPLPNIEYNLRSGNTLLGYVDISRFKDIKSLDLEYWTNENSLYELLEKREKLIRTYKAAKYTELKKLRSSIEEINDKIKKLLDFEFYKELKSKKIEITKEDLNKLKPFHWGFEFSDVFDSESPKEEKGFDVIIGNPPYGNILKDIEKKAISNFKTKNASEIAANFIERTLEIVETNGFIGLIVANSIAINKSTSSARDLIRKYMSKSKMALFGTRPAKIFADAEIRVLIFLGEKDNSEKIGVIYTTDAIKFTQKQKSTLLDNLSFESTDGLTLGKEKIGDNIGDVSLPKVGNSVIRSILLKLKENSEIVIKDRINKKGFKEKMEFRKTGGYWLNALEKMPYKSTKIEEVRFEHPLERDFGILLIISSLFYLYWSTYGNLRDFPLSLLGKFPFPKLDVLTKNKNKVIPLKEKISKCLLNCFLPDTGRVGEFRTAKCKDVIDYIDDFLGEIYGLNNKEVEFIKKYDNHIRRV